MVTRGRVVAEMVTEEFSVDAMELLDAYVLVGDERSDTIYDLHKRFGC